jgi:hypothetical protein
MIGDDFWPRHAKGANVRNPASRTSPYIVVIDLGHPLSLRDHDGTPCPPLASTTWPPRLDIVTKPLYDLGRPVLPLAGAGDRPNGRGSTAGELSPFALAAVDSPALSYDRKAPQMFDKTKERITAPVRNATITAVIAIMISLLAVFISLGKAS